MTASRILEKIIRGGLLASFFVPLVLFPTSFIFPFIVPKIVIFRSLVAILLGAYVLLLIVAWQNYRPRFTLLSAAVGLFFLSFIASTFAGVDWYHSFWDNHERMLGLFTLAHYIAYYLIATSVVREPLNWQRQARLFLAAGGVVMAIGIIQTVNPEFLLNRGSGRVSGTLGNPIYYSGYGLFLSALGYLALWSEKRRGWKIYALLSALLGVVGVFLGETRGTMLGLAVGVVALFTTYVLAARDNRRLRRFVVGLGASALLLAGILFVFRQTPVVQKVPALSRLLNTSLTDATAGTRFMAWSIAVEAWQDKPIFGWGPNNYFYAFNAYYRPEFLLQGWRETWFDNAHNIVMNTLAVQGIVGVGAYLALFAAAFWLLIAGYHRGRFNIHWLAAGAFLCGHFIHNFFVFENPTSYLYFFWFLAWINAQAYPPEPLAVGVSRRFPAVAGVAVFIAAALVIFTTNINVARANRATLTAVSLLRAYPAKALEAYDKALAYGSPHIDDIRGDFSRYASDFLISIREIDRLPEGQRMAAVIDSALSSNRQLHPLDIRVHLQQIGWLQFLGVTRGDAQLLSEAEKISYEAIALSPRRQQLKYQLATLKLNLRKFSEAEAVMQEVINDEPRVGESWWRLAVIYKEIGQPEAAEAVIREAEAKGVVFDQGSRDIIESSLGLTTTAP